MKNKIMMMIIFLFFFGSSTIVVAGMMKPLKAGETRRTDGSIYKKYKKRSPAVAPKTTEALKAETKKDKNK